MGKRINVSDRYDEKGQRIEGSLYYSGVEMNPFKLTGQVTEAQYKHLFAPYLNAPDVCAVHAHLIDSSFMCDMPSGSLSLDESLARARDTRNALQDDAVQANIAAAKKLLSTTAYSSSPLSEYNDPNDLADEYAGSASGAIQSFIAKYGTLKTAKQVWVNSYEGALIDLLGSNAQIDSLAKLNKYDSYLVKALKSVADSIEASALKKTISIEGEVLNVSLAALSDSQKFGIKKDCARVEILKAIRDKTSDEFLKEACKNCMGAYFSNTVHTVQEVLLKELPTLGLSAAQAVNLATLPAISTSVSVGTLASISSFLTSAAAGLGYAEIFVFAADVLGKATHMDKRLDSYLRTRCLEEIAATEQRVYASFIPGSKLDNAEACSNLLTAFDVVRTAKQQQYASMAGIFTSGTWSKVQLVDPYLTSACASVKKVTKDNYRKKASLEKIKAGLTADTLALTGKDKAHIGVTGASHLSKTTYKSSNTKVATVNSKGVVTSKSASGICQVSVVVKQYGNRKETLSLTLIVGPQVVGSGSSRAAYTVTKAATAKSDGEVTLSSTRLGTSAKKATVPSSVKISGRSYRVTGIGASAFRNMKKLQSVSIGGNVRTIGASAFSGCTGLTSTSIGKSAASIGKSAFANCKSLKRLTLRTTKLTSAKVGANAFKGTPQNMTVKCGSKAPSYKSWLYSKGVSKRAVICS